jgi:tRNA threonylcarbamoyladenosine biosynthesis protein TsaE
VSTSELEGSERTVLCRSAGETAALGGRLAAALAVTDGAPAVLYLQGDLGTGKTTFARGFLEQLGVDTPVRSPTYTLLELYESGTISLLHLDLYRLHSPSELDELGLREWARPGHAWLVEWPERGVGRLPPADLTAGFSITAEGHEVRLRAMSPLGDSWLARLPLA